MCLPIYTCVCKDAWQKGIPCLVVQKYSARCLLLYDICNKNLKCKTPCYITVLHASSGFKKKSFVSKCIKLKLLKINEQAKHIQSVYYSVPVDGIKVF
jgi:hypothetical protein